MSVAGAVLVSAGFIGSLVMASMLICFGYLQYQAYGLSDATASPTTHYDIFFGRNFAP